MQDVAKTLGFKSGEITTLEDGDATLAAITREIRKLRSVGRDDQVLIYFSGHGDHIRDTSGDEEDGEDEILVPHDVRIEDGKVVNALLDDDFGKLLAQIPSQNLMLLNRRLPTAARRPSPSPTLDQTGKSKYAGLSGISKAVSVRGGMAARNLVVAERPGPGHVLLSAALDNELAQATREGSAFTLRRVPHGQGRRCRQEPFGEAIGKRRSSVHQGQAWTSSAGGYTHRNSPAQTIG